MTTVLYFRYVSSAVVKRAVMPFEGNAKSEFEKLPTFRAYCKSKGEDAQLGAKIVQLIWFPNKYPSLSLDTESYRLRIPCEKDTSTELIDFLETAVNEEQVLVIRVTDAAEFAYEIDVLPNESGDWTQIGDHGQKCQVREKPKTNRRKSPK